MGVSASTTRETQRANERAFIRSLGDRYPLGDAEIRKWCWVYNRLSSSSPLPSDQLSQDSSNLSVLAIWSAVYGEYNPYVRKSESESHAHAHAPNNSFDGRVHAGKQLSEAIAYAEQYIFSSGLSSDVSQRALRLGIIPKPKSAETDLQSASTAAELAAFEESYYSIDSLVNKYMKEDGSQSQVGLEDFLEGISCACGRRGSRTSLSKLFAIASNKAQPGRNEKVDAFRLISTAYYLALGSSYLKSVAANKGNTKCLTDFVPEDNPKVMQSMVDSLIQSASKQRQSGGGMGGNFGYNYAIPAPTNTESSTYDDDTTVTLEEFTTWTETQAPMIGSALPTFLHVLFTFFSSASDKKEQRFPPGVTPLWIPTLTVEQSKQTTHSSSPTSTFFQQSTSFDLFALSCTSLTLSAGRWHRLFSSEANGLSANRLMHSIFGYGGPTIIIIRSKDTTDEGKCGSGVFGAFTFTPWTEESSNFYGNSDCFLFRLGPDPMAVYRPTGGDVSGYGTNNEKQKEDATRNYMYYNPEARSKGYDGLSHGIGFGGTHDLPRLFIDDVLDKCRAAREDLTYEKGPLLSGLKDSNSSTSHFEVETIEAWGVGTSQLVDEALEARYGQRLDKQKEIQKAMKGAKGQFLEDMQSGFHGNKIFGHRDQIRGREGDCGLEEEEEEKS